MTPKHGVWSSNLPGRATLFHLYIQQIAAVALSVFFKLCSWRNGEMRNPMRGAIASVVAALAFSLAASAQIRGAGNSAECAKLV